MAESNATGNCIKNTVAALMTKGSTISASEISLETRKARDREMDILLNRFSKPVSVESGSDADVLKQCKNQEISRHVQAHPMNTPPPIPPPMPPSNFIASTNSPRSGHVEAKCIIKRKSSG